MKTKLYFLTLFCLYSFIAKSQNWTQVANLTGSIRANAISFTINGKGYVGLGRNTPTIFNDLWEYDPTLNTWTQKANFPIGNRYGAFCFSIGNKGYVGCGHDGSIYRFDFWEYDPSTDTWTQKAPFPGPARTGAVGFSIGNKGYVGTGGSNVSPYVYNDFYEYDPSSNTWSTKANFGGTGRSNATGFSVGNKGYIGTGGSGTMKDFWEYNPTLNTWVQKADFAGVARYDAVGLSIGTKGFIGLGYDGNPPTPYKQDFWEYNPTTDIWTQKTNFGGTSRHYAVGFSIGTKGYVGSGSSNLGTYKDFWVYDICYGISITSNKTNVSCNGGNDGSATVNLIGGSSPLSYLWSNGQTTQTATGLNAGSHNVTVTDSNGCIRTTTVTITEPPLLTSIETHSNVCGIGNNNGTATTIVSGGTSPYSYSWNTIPIQTTYTATNLIAGTYIATVTDFKGCTISTSTVIIIENPIPTVPTINLNVNILESDATTGNQWYNQNGLIIGATNPNYTPTLNGDYYVIVTINGCSSIPSNTIHVTITRIENNFKENSISIYPNPVTNDLIIQNNGKSSKIKFEIINSLGQVVFVGKLEEKTIVQTTNFIDGIYLIKLDNGKTFEFKKIVKE